MTTAEAYTIQRIERLISKIKDEAARATAERLLKEAYGS